MNKIRNFFSYQFAGRGKDYAALIAGTVVAVVVISIFVIIANDAQEFYKSLIAEQPTLSFLITPISFFLIIYVAKTHFFFSQGSGIPQVLAANNSKNKWMRGKLLSLKIALQKSIMICLGLLSGATVGIEGPSIHIGASILYSFSRYIKVKRKAMIHAFIAIGASIGLVVVSNSPIAGFIFIVEELRRTSRKQALLLIGLFSGAIYLIMFWWREYHLIHLDDMSAHSVDLSLLWQFIPLVILTGLLGGFFVKFTLFFVAKIIRHRRKRALIIALFLGLMVATFNYMSQGQVAGSGHEEVLLSLAGYQLGLDFIAMKYLASIASFATAMPGGMFMPSISVGAAIGGEVANFYPQISHQTVVLMTMIGYLSAVLRMPITATFVILEMTAAMDLILPGIVMAVAATLVSQQIFKGQVHEILAENFLRLSKQHRDYPGKKVPIDYDD